MSEANTLYRIESLRLELGGREVLRVPHLELERGKVYALVGPNGSGKTVLLSLLAGLRLPTGGDILYGGKSTKDKVHRRLMRRQVSMVQQNPYLFRGTVASNISFGLKIRGRDRDRRKEVISQVLDQVGLQGFEERRIRGLSGGEVQRIALARVLAFSPSVVLLDEPTANVDAASVRLMEEMILRIAASGERTVIFTTHNLGQADRLAKRIFLLSMGRLVSSRMRNYFRGVVRKDEGRIVFDTGRAVFAIGSGGIGMSGYLGVEETSITLAGEGEERKETNTLKGMVTGLAAENGGVRVEIDAGERFTLRLTWETLERKKIVLGKKVDLSFPPEAARLL